MTQSHLEEGNRELRNAMYGIRVLVFIETDPQSNKYNQVLLNPEQFKAMTDTICRKEGKQLDNDLELTMMETSDEVYELPDLQEIDK